MKFFLLLAIIFFSSFNSSQGKSLIDSQKSTSPNYALIVVNGIPITDSEAFMALMDPNDIEKIEILKDASSTAIYGVRGVNGVILVTLKKNVKLIPLAKLLKRFGVNKKLRQYSAFVENEKINCPNEFLASPKWIKEIIVLNRSNSQINIPFLNIVTNK